jgi:hypothetical protein
MTRSKEGMDKDLTRLEQTVKDLVTEVNKLRRETAEAKAHASLDVDGKAVPLSQIVAALSEKYGMRPERIEATPERLEIVETVKD